MQFASGNTSGVAEFGCWSLAEVHGCAGPGNQRAHVHFELTVHARGKAGLAVPLVLLSPPPSFRPGDWIDACKCWTNRVSGMFSMCYVVRATEVLIAQ